jgi:alanine dehydrogenase
LAYTPDHPLRLGILREGKVPPDERVPLAPAQIQELRRRYPQLDVVVQPSPVRRIADAEYAAAGIPLQEDLSDRDILLGVKEVPIAELIPEKTYLFFSHTYKFQPYNAPLLAAILRNRIRLIDYELLRRPSGKRIIGFGRWAGLVGAYNGFRAYGLKSGRYTLPRAIDTAGLAEMLEVGRKNIQLPSNFAILLTGFGRVGSGAKEILDALGIREVHKDDFVRGGFSEPVYAHLNVDDYNAHRLHGGFSFTEFVADPAEFRSTFMDYAVHADLYIAGHFWSEGSPFLFTHEDMRRPDWRVGVVADISCDVDGPVACTLRASTIAEPIYGYDPQTEREVAFNAPGAITVMAVDNLPCELPRDASEGFGRELLDHVIPLLVEGDSDEVLFAATETTLSGELNAPYRYLASYAQSGAT